MVNLLELERSGEEQAILEAVTKSLGQVWASVGALFPAEEQTASQEEELWDLEQWNIWCMCIVNFDVRFDHEKNTK